MSAPFLRIVDILINSFFPLLKAGMKFTVTLAVVSFAFGLIFAFILAISKLSGIKVLVVISSFIVWSVRGIPLIVLLFLIFYGLPRIGIVFGPFTAAVIGFTINEGAYSGEVIRASILSVSRGQWEATKAIGMTPFQTLRYVVVPQAAVVAVPPLTNNFISLVKDTSLAAILTVPEMFQIGQQIVAVTYEPLWLYMEVGFIYVMFCSILSLAQSKLEVFFGKHLTTLKM
jgi:L-cystine transport system permease protein